MYTPDCLNPQLEITVRDKKLGVLGYVMIDRLVNGVSCGGIRMAEDISSQEIARLAHEMTMKFAFVNIAYGGAKAGIIKPKNITPKQREEIFLSFGRNIGPLIRNGIYVAGEDLGTYPQDLFHVFQGAGRHVDYSSLEADNSGYYTALTVFLTANVIAQKRGLHLVDCTVAIEGFGKVGSNLAKIMSAHSMKLVAVSTIKGALYNPSGLDVDELMCLHKQYGDDLVNYYRLAEHIAKDALLRLDVDILVPCARPDTINSDNATMIKARLIVPGANIPYSSTAEAIMMKNNISFVPGFVSNCGGILKGFLNWNGFSDNEIEKMIINYFVGKIERLFERSKRQDISLLETALLISQENLVKTQQRRQMSSKQKIAMFIKEWRRGGMRELVDTLLWCIYKQSVKYKFRFFTRHFAERYIKSKLFGA